MLDAVDDILALVAMTVLDRDRSRTICIDFMDNPFHGFPDDEDDFRRMQARDGTTKCHRYCTAFVIAQGKPLTLALEPVDGNDSKADAVERLLACVETYSFEIEQILMDQEELQEIPGSTCPNNDTIDDNSVVLGWRGVSVRAVVDRVAVARACPTTAWRASTSVGVHVQ